jgi:uncharacterized protein (DUF934 family)
MLIIKRRELVENKWRYDFSDEFTGISPQSIISYQRWIILDRLVQKSVSAVALFPEDEIDFEDTRLLQLKLIAVVFPNFHEGRGYTQASLIREHNFNGELRAIGAHRDNLSLLERCGFDAFDLADEQDIQQVLSAFNELGLAFAS